MPKEDKNQEEAAKPTRIDANQTLTLEVIARNGKMSYKNQNQQD